MAKYAEYRTRFQARLQKQATKLARQLSEAYAGHSKPTDPTGIFARIAHADGAQFRDPWGTSLVFEPVPWDSTKNYYLLRSAGPDRQLNTC